MKDLIDKRIKAYRKEIQENIAERKMLPEDRIIIKRIGSNTYYYQRSDNKDKKTNKYKCLGNINEVDKDFITDILRKDILNVKIKAADNNVKVLEKALKKLIICDYKKVYKKLNLCPQQIYDGESLRENVLLKYGGKEQELIEIVKDLKTGSFREEDLVHVTVGGLRVRSKSELLIASALEDRNLCFRYEAELKVGDHASLRPDFAVVRPYDMKVIYWEHFGLMGDREYAEKTMKKLVTYQNNGCCLWDNLVISFDSVDGRFDMNMINRIIDTFIDFSV